MNPLGYSDFGFSTANEAEPSEDANGSANGGGAEAKMEVSQLSLSSHMNFSKYSDNRHHIPEPEARGAIITLL